MTDRGRSTIRVINENGPLGFLLFVAYIGAAVYFVERADGFWGVVLALLEAIVWPAYLIYGALQGLQV
jgi:hypothetical protein